MPTLECTARKPGSIDGYHNDACRCDDCSLAAMTYEKHRRRQIAYGRWQPYIDAEPARQHVRALMATGLGWERVAALAGLPKSTVEQVMYGKPGKKPCARVRPATAAALLAVKADPKSLAAGAIVDATGTHRRIKALMAIGWCLSDQAKMVGRDRNAYYFYLRHSAITAETARLVADLYERMWDKPAPKSIGQTRALATARRLGYAPPLAWDNIDDPDEMPHAPIGVDDRADDVLVEQIVKVITTEFRRVKLAERAPREVDRNAVMRQLAARGFTPSTIAGRVGSGKSTVEKVLSLPPIDAPWVSAA